MPNFKSCGQLVSLISVHVDLLRAIAGHPYKHTVMHAFENKLADQDT